MLSRSPGCSTRLFELLKGLVKNWWASDTSLKDNAMEASDATNSFVRNHAGVSDQVRCGWPLPPVWRKTRPEAPSRGLRPPPDPRRPTRIALPLRADRGDRPPTTRKAADSTGGRAPGAAAATDGAG